MAKQGKRVSDHIRKFIIDTKRNAPGLSGRLIADRVVERFGQENRVDKSSVSRFVKNIPLSGETASSGVDDSQAMGGAFAPSAQQSADLRPSRPNPQAIYRLESMPSVRLKTLTVGPVSPRGACVKNFGRIDAGQTREFTAIEALCLGKDDLVALRMSVLDNVAIAISRGACGDVPASNVRRQWVDFAARSFDSTLASTEFWLWGGNRDIKFLVRNPTRYSLNVSRVTFTGWSINVRLVDSAEAGQTTSLREGWN